VIRIFSIFFMLMLSAGIVVAGFELKSWNRSPILFDEQALLLNSDTQLISPAWKEYLNHDVRIVAVTAKVFEVSLENINHTKISSLLDRFQKIKHAKLHKLHLIADKQKQTFDLLVVLTLP
tara:strand:+ start:1283 stop:1645 length:363 start_codon:yes stop_codon:yes gene_type:complete